MFNLGEKQSHGGSDKKDFTTGGTIFQMKSWFVKKQQKSPIFLDQSQVFVISTLWRSWEKMTGLSSCWNLLLDWGFTIRVSSGAQDPPCRGRWLHQSWSGQAGPRSIRDGACWRHRRWHLQVQIQVSRPVELKNVYVCLRLEFSYSS